MNDVAQNRTNSLVPAAYYTIFLLRITGLTYKQISERTNYHEDTIRHLFCADGALRKLYREWTENYKKENLDEGMDSMFAHLPDFIKAGIIDAKTTGSMVGFVNRKLFMEYTLGKPEERIKLDAKVGVYTFADWIKQQTLAKKEHEKSNRNNGGVSTEASGVHEGGLA